VIWRIQDEDIDVAEGEDLDTIGERHGVRRKPAQSYGMYGGQGAEADGDFRERIKSAMPNKRKVEEKNFFVRYKNVNGCECAAWIMGFVDPSERHSTWCKLYRRF
jgi:hypothetical protein